MTIIADTPESVALFRMTVIASGAALYINTGMKPNRMYTPTNMRNALNEVTGSKARNLKAALTAYVDVCATFGTPVTNPQVLKAIGR